MSLPWSAVLVLMLLGARAVAQPREEGTRALKARRIFLADAGKASRDQVLRLAPGVVTTVLFDTPIVPASVDREALGRRFTHFVVDPSALVLKPAEELPEKDPPRLTVRFAGEAAPSSATFLLTTDAREVDVSVEVVRKPASAEELAAELTELRARCAVTEAGLGALRKQCALSGLAGAILSGVVGDEGVSAQRLTPTPLWEGIIFVPPAYFFRAHGWAAVALYLDNPPDAAPWEPGVARLRRWGKSGQPEGDARDVPVHLVEGRLEPGERARVVVEWLLEAGAPQEDYSLEVLDRTGRRGVRWERLGL
jgi:uncharacterized protein (TIGR02268 family)